MKAYSVSSGEWHETLQVDEEIFDTYEGRCQEAITQSIERWAKSYYADEDVDEAVKCRIDSKTCVATPHQDNYEPYIMHTEDVFANIGRSDLFWMLWNHNALLEQEEEHEREEIWFKENATEEMKAERAQYEQRMRHRIARRKKD